MSRQEPLSFVTGVVCLVSVEQTEPGEGVEILPLQKDGAEWFRDPNVYSVHGSSQRTRVLKLWSAPLCPSGAEMVLVYICILFYFILCYFMLFFTPL